MNISNRFFNICTIVSVLSIVVLVFGCRAVNLKQEADQVCQALMADLSNEDYNNAASKYSDIFFTVTPRKEWEEGNKEIIQKLGKILDYKLLSWHIEKPPQAKMPIVARYKYRVTYEKLILIQSIVLHKEDAGSFKIVSHLVDLQK